MLFYILAKRRIPVKRGRFPFSGVFKLNFIVKAAQIVVFIKTYGNSVCKLKQPALCDELPLKKKIVGFVVERCRKPMNLKTIFQAKPGTAA